GQFISATATDPAGNTSEFSADIIVAYTTAQIREAYGLPPLDNLPADWSGAGQTIAIVIPYHDDKLLSDVQAFDTQFGITPFDSGGPTLTILPTGQSDPTGVSEAEEAMDVEWAHAIAPGANIDVVECDSDSDADLSAGVVTAAGLSGVSVVSMSWRLDIAREFDGEQSYDSDFTTPANHQGVTFLAATGDYGSPAQYPASSPYVVAVGGTTLYLNPDNSYNSEIGWSTGSDTGLPYENAASLASGGGPSAHEKQPTYQSNVVPTSMSMSTVNGLLYRTTPDVSFDADPATGVAEYDSTPLTLLIAVPWKALSPV